MSALPLDDDELEALAMRYSPHPASLEWKLLSAFLRLNTCWHCLSEIEIDEHPRCLDCPDWDESAEPELEAEAEPEEPRGLTH